MNYPVDGILQDVRVLMDMDRVPNALLEAGDLDTLTTDDIIRSTVADAVRCAHTEAPYHLLEQGHNLGPSMNVGGHAVSGDNASVIWDTCLTGVGRVIIPDDFLRLVVFQMSDWERAVYHAITPADPSYSMQYSELASIRGNYKNPVVALAVRPFGRVLEFFSSKSSSARIEYGVYLKEPRIVDDAIDISEGCYRAALHKAAALTLSILGETEKAAAHEQTYKSLLV